jgi:PAS domain S-box-containing protein
MNPAIPPADEFLKKTEKTGSDSDDSRGLLALQAVGVAITSGLDLQHILDTVTREIAWLLEMKACTLSVWNPEASAITLLASHDPDQWLGGRLPLADGEPAVLHATRYVLEEHRIRQITTSQPELDPAERTYLQNIGIRTLLELPMINQDRVIGLVRVMDDREGRFLDSGTLSLAQLLANQAANAIEKDRLYETASRHAAEVITLNRIGQVITSILDLHRALAIIADHAAWLLDVEAASVILYDQESGDLWFGAASGYGARFVRDRRLARGRGTIDWVIQQGEPLLIPDASRDPRFFDEWDRASGFTTHSILCVPLKTKGQVIGVIEALNKQSGPFDREDLTLLTSMAASAAIAIENARLYEKAQQEIAERTRVEARLRKLNRALRTLSECHEAMAWAREEGELLQEVCRLLVEVGRHRLAWVGFAEQSDRKQIEVQTWAGHNAGFLEIIPLTWSEAEPACDPMGTAIRTRRPCLVKDLCAEPACACWLEEARQRGYGSAIALPLIADDQTLGGLTIYGTDPDAFDAGEVNLLKELANDLAFGLMALRTRAERDRLYEELQDHATKLEETVSERTRELQFERDRTQSILEAVGEAVIVTDLEGKIQYLNPAAVELTGYTADEAIGHSPRLWQHSTQPTSSPLETEIDPAALQARRAEVVSRRRDGALYDAAMTVAPLFDSQKADQLIGFVSVQRDITPIKEAERLKDQFVSNVSHELRTPLSILTLISGNLDRLYDRLDDEQRCKMVRDIRDHAQVLNALIGDVLEISRIESGRVSMERQTADLAKLVREEVEKQLPLAQKKSQVLRMTGTQSVLVWGNTDQLRQVIRNLLNNAIKYTPDRGQITCECQLLTSSEASEEAWPGSTSLEGDRWAAFRVVDTGVGIGQKDLPHLYERFYRVKNESSIPGTGLGLSIAQQLVELHEGHIAVASTLGEGSTFAVYLPLMED